MRPKVWNVLCTLGGIQQGLLLPRGLGREVCLFKIYALQLAGLPRILSPGFTSWTFSPLPPKCCRWVADACFATSLCVCAAVSHSKLLCMTLLLIWLFCPVLSADSCISCLILYHCATIIMLDCFLLLTQLSLCSSLQCFVAKLPCFSAQPTLFLSRYANFVYLGLRRLLAGRHLSAVSSPGSVAIGGKYVCAYSIC